MKRILVIGATSAIAAACARIWAGQGASLFLVARNDERLESVASDLAARGAAATSCFRMDGRDTAAHRSMVEAAVANLGQIDIVLIAFGTLPDQAACERDVDLTLREVAINATSIIGMLTFLANVFEHQRCGAIGVITSVAGDRGRPSNYVYGSAKAMVATFCEGLRARMFKSGVTLTDIRPGFVATPMTAALQLPRALVATPEAVAKRIVAGMARGKDVLYTPAYWMLIMLIVRNIPGFVFKRLKL